MAQLFSNNASTKLTTLLGISDTTFTVTTGEGAKFNSGVYTGSSHWELLTLTDGTDWEVVKVTNILGDVFTVTRGYELGTQKEWPIGTTVEARITKATLSSFVQNNTTNTEALSIGRFAAGSSDFATAVGWSAYSFGLNSTAVGAGSQSYYEYGSAFGSYARAGAAHSLRSSSNNSTAIELGYAVSTSSGGHKLVCTTAGTTGASVPTFNTSAIGDTTTDGTVTWTYLGADTTGSYNLSAGYLSSALMDNSTTFGIKAASASNSTSIGFNTLSTSGSTSIGYSATSISNLGIALGSNAINRIGESNNITGLSLIRKDNGEAATDEHLYFTGSQAIVFSKEIDLKTLADDVSTITIPTGSTFYPDEVGVVVTSADTVTVQPEVSFGITGNTTAVLTQTATTKSAAKGRDVFTPSSKDGVTSLTTSVKVAATATTLLGRFYWKGILVEDE